MAREWRGRPLRNWALLVLLAGLGVRGLAGGAQFVVVPSGAVVGVPTDVLAPIPVSDFLLPGIVLLVGLGVVPMAVAYGLYRGRGWARAGATAVGVLLIGWSIAEGLLLGFGERLQLVNLLYGVAVAALAVTVEPA